MGGIPPGSFDWNVERVELLRRLYADGVSASRIAKEVGAPTRNSVIGKINRLGLRRATAQTVRPRQFAPEPTRAACPVVARPTRIIPSIADCPQRFVWTPEREDIVRRLYANGVPASQIAKQIDAPNRNIVNGCIQRLRLPRPIVDEAARFLPKVSKDDVFTAPEGAYLVTIDELRSRGDCRWPYGHRPPYLYCGKPSTDGSYCCEHGQLAYASDARPTTRVYAPMKSGRGLQMQREAQS